MFRRAGSCRNRPGRIGARRRTSGPETSDSEAFHGPDTRNGVAVRNRAFPMGDRVRIDADGGLVITGRARDPIKSGDDWINPAEIWQWWGALTGKIDKMRLRSEFGNG